MYSKHTENKIRFFGRKNKKIDIFVREKNIVFFLQKKY